MLEECIKGGKMDLVTLQNLHLMPKSFENDLERVSQTASPNFRCIISSEPPALPTIVIIPEPLFSSRKFGAIGWSTKYNFNKGDLQIVQM